MKLLFLSPIVLAPFLFTAPGYGLYLLFTTFSDVFGGRYGSSTGTVGLTFLGLRLAAWLAWDDGGVSDSVFRGMVAAGRRKMPEFRLLPMVYGISTIPVVSVATSARPFCRGNCGIFAV